MSDYKIKLALKYKEVLQFEDYLQSSAIEGVWAQPLKKHHSDNGAFMEYLRLNRDGVQGLSREFIPRQISVSWAEPDRINAFHIHVKEEQNELWCVLDGCLMVWLIDCRANSSTVNVKSKFILNGEQPMILHIPSGIAHGYRSSKQKTTLLYAMDAQFNMSDPNEGRIPWDFFGAELWDEDRG